MWDRVKVLLKSKKYLLVFVIILIAIATVVALLVSAPVSAEQQKEQEIKRELEGELQKLNKVNYVTSITNLEGFPLGNYELLDSEGKQIALATYDDTSGEIVSITYAEIDRIPGDQKMSQEEALTKAIRYNNRRVKDEEQYTLTSELLHSDWTDGLDREFWQYQFLWNKSIGDVLLPDSVSVFVDAGSGEIISWRKYDSRCPLPESKEELEAKISYDEAVKIAKGKIPSPEKWWEEDRISASCVSETEFNVSEEALKYYKQLNAEGNPRLMWEVMIEYTLLAKIVAANDAGIHEGDEMGGTFYIVTIDAKTGEVLDIKSCL